MHLLIGAAVVFWRAGLTWLHYCNPVCCLTSTYCLTNYWILNIQCSFDLVFDRSYWSVPLFFRHFRFWCKRPQTSNPGNYRQLLKMESPTVEAFRYGASTDPLERPSWSFYRSEPSSGGRLEVFSCHLLRPPYVQSSVAGSWLVAMKAPMRLSLWGPWTFHFPNPWHAGWLTFHFPAGGLNRHFVHLSLILLGCFSRMCHHSGFQFWSSKIF